MSFGILGHKMAVNLDTKSDFKLMQNKLTVSKLIGLNFMNHESCLGLFSMSEVFSGAGSK